MLLRIIALATVLVLILVLGVFLLPVRKVDPHPAIVYDEFRNIAHRGGADLAPENTLPAFRRGLEAGADILEMDVHHTADARLVVIHDFSVDRTTDGSGAVDSLTLAQLQELDAGYHWRDASGSYPYRGRGIRIPTLQEVFEAFPEQRMVVELKPSDAVVARDLCSALSACGTAESVVVASFHYSALRAFRAACPEVATSASSREATVYWLLHAIGLSKLYSPAFNVLQMPMRARSLQLITPRFVRKARARGLPVEVWTINDDQAMVELLDLGVDGIMTDRPDLLRQVLRRNPPRPTGHVR